MKSHLEGYKYEFDVGDSSDGIKYKEELIHLLFKIGVVFNGIDGALEAIAGVALFFTTTALLRNLVDWLREFHGKILFHMTMDFNGQSSKASCCVAVFRYNQPPCYINLSSRSASGIPARCKPAAIPSSP